MAGLKDRYKKEIAPALQKSLGVKNSMQVPRLAKIVVNMGFDAAIDKDGVKAVAQDLSRITGQVAVITKAKKSISNFKLREGMPIGAKVTLRGDRMYDFLERLIHAGLPRIRDFRGVSPTGFDGHGNYTMGLREQTIFPEVNPDEVKVTQGMDVTIVTTATTNDAARALLALMGLPFAKPHSEKNI
jgi:large subunit ribosomal protein L5